MAENCLWNRNILIFWIMQSSESTKSVILMKEKKKNTDNLIACMKNEKVHFVSHPDDDHTPLDYERLVSAAKQYRVALKSTTVRWSKKTAV